MQDDSILAMPTFLLFYLDSAPVPIADEPDTRNRDLKKPEINLTVAAERTAVWKNTLTKQEAGNLRVILLNECLSLSGETYIQ
jgi:hypothetical protein